MSYNVNQIYSIVNDAVEDALAKNAGVTKIETTDLVSLGKALDDYNLLDGWFGALATRIAKTVYFIRTYEGSHRKILRDELEYGAFIQKVYYTMPDAVENASWAIPDGDGDYAQASPYDVETTIAVTSKIFGGKGTWSIEFVRPIVQIKEAFLSEAKMAAFIDGIYVACENSMKLDEERLVALAANTAMAMAIKNGLFVNLLNLYNIDHDDEVITVSEALKNADFLKLAGKEIREVIKNMAEMSTAYNVDGYTTFTPAENVVVEMLSKFASATSTYLEADTFHNEMVALPNYEEVTFWQSSGKKFDFEDVSKINIDHDDLALEVGDSTTVEQGGILCFIHDTENVAANFGNRRSWEMVNPRSEVVIHGEKAEKGYSVDGCANGFVFLIEDAGDITVSGSAGTPTLKYQHAYAGVENSITVETGETPTASGITFKQVGATDEYTFTPATNADIAITVSSS